MQVTNCRYTSPGLRCRIRSASPDASSRSEEHTSELQSQSNLVCRLLLEKKKTHQILAPLLKSCLFILDHPHDTVVSGNTIGCNDYREYILITSIAHELTELLNTLSGIID